MKIAFGADHAGYCLELELIQWAQSQGHDVSRFGAESTDPYDYPDAADLVAAAVIDAQADFGVLICGSGIGVDIRANRYPQIRAANCCSAQMAALSREHNHANVLCLGARLIDADLARTILQTFLATPESQEPRHCRRIEKMDRPVG